MRILFEKNRAIIGLEYHQDNMVRRVRATNMEVILCGGAINSPQLLMLSGVGNANDLGKVVLPLVTNYSTCWWRKCPGPLGDVYPSG